MTRSEAYNIIVEHLDNKYFEESPFRVSVDLLLREAEQKSDNQEELTWE